MRGVFDISGKSQYDDLIAVRYHFPAKYLRVAQQLVGEWILYRETRAANGTMSYISVAFVDKIEADEYNSSRFYARMSKYIQLDDPVPYRDASGRFFEQTLRALGEASGVGRALRGSSIRVIDEEDFEQIVAKGFDKIFQCNIHEQASIKDSIGDDLAEISRLDTPIERRVKLLLTNRKIRDVHFRNQVLAAYDSTCALTGLKMLHNGRFEAQAAHIFPVSEGGPDQIQNGIALSATIHWLFDNNVITLSNDYSLIIAKSIIPEPLLNLLPKPGERIRLPMNPIYYPRRDYIERHRSRFQSLFT